MYTPRQNLHSSNHYSTVKYCVWNTNVGAHSSILNSHSLFKRPSINNQNSFSHKKRLIFHSIQMFVQTWCTTEGVLYFFPNAKQVFPIKALIFIDLIVLTAVHFQTTNLSKINALNEAAWPVKKVAQGSACNWCVSSTSKPPLCILKELDVIFSWIALFMISKILWG